jgi:hypothetical protein
VKVFEVRTPDRRSIRHSALSLAALKAALQPGYEPVAEVYGADAEMKNGWSVPFGGQTLMGALLEAHGDEMKAWLRANLPTLDGPPRRET